MRRTTVDQQWEEESMAPNVASVDCNWSTTSVCPWPTKLVYESSTKRVASPCLFLISEITPRRPCDLPLFSTLPEGSAQTLLSSRSSSTPVIFQRERLLLKWDFPPHPSFVLCFQTLMITIRACERRKKNKHFFIWQTLMWTVALADYNAAVLWLSSLIALALLTTNILLSLLVWPRGATGLPFKWWADGPSAWWM